MDNEELYKQLKRLEQERDKLKKKLGTKEVQLANAEFDLHFEEMKTRELKAYKDVNEDFKKAWDELNKKYTEVLKLAKENADSNEYCLQELEKENKELKEQAQLDGECIDKLIEARDMYAKALEEIKNKLLTIIDCGKLLGDADDVIADCFTVIKEVLQ